ncbi:hypothetical protein [Burkholderia plantarii]|uniref:hypothetical protein n=1 Tax=Burkholderia plantarii TaxID=41899 RepID=UPI0006D897B0|nr:hypothetical protein [Burkholderia plantarii]ALK32616.1 adenosine deaminase [Burkholderia plantarii]GLZ19989.1 hypothetical protein Bpla01_35180 [Burkholderia plantarii]
MSGLPISTPSLLACALLSSHRVLASLQAGSLHAPLADDDLREALYLTHQPWAAREPDHVFRRAWEAWDAYRQPHDGPPLLAAMRILAEEFLTARHGELHVKLDRFGVWQQSVLSRISGLALQAAAHVWPPRDCFLQPLLAAPGATGAPAPRQPHTLLLPYDPLVEEYFHREGLHETHLHLNGSTHAELCWLRALDAPDQETDEFAIKLASGSREAHGLRELARSIQPDFTIVELKRQLFIARQLRGYLLAAAFGCLNNEAALPATFEALYTEALSFTPPPVRCNPPDHERLARRGAIDVTAEREWLYRLLVRLCERPSVTLTNMLHGYLLLQNLYYRLLVQSEDQYGFDQFQKLTWTDLREPAEKDYLERFRAMHGPLPAHSRIVYLEGRFAPKQTDFKNLELLERILRGYWRYRNDDNPPSGFTKLLRDFDARLREPAQGRRLRLALVAHFIKSPETTDDKPYRFYALRTRLVDQAHALCSIFSLYPSLRHWIRGIDAAANELDAPPEVFASTFRICRAAGVTRRSYHAGEDFHHLMSGIRAILDAMELLDLRDGDRIGHGTAMGIDPELWLQRMPGQVRLRKDEWLLDLLAAWQLLQASNQTALAYKVERELTELGGELFGSEISAVTLDRAMRLRGLNVAYLDLVFSRSTREELAANRPRKSIDIVSPLHDAERAEARRVDDAIRTRPGDCKLLWRWLGDDALRERGRELMPVACGHFSASEYVTLQQALMKIVQQRRVLIETLPSSNVRISQYQHFEEHHVFRWMRLPGALKSGDPEIMVTLGSDDPGIFAGELAGEFYQIYAVLRERGLADKEALSLVAALNERGREYRFHDFALG